MSLQDNVSMPDIDESAFEVQGADQLSAQGDQIAANQVTLDTTAIDAANEQVSAVGNYIGSRIGAKDTVSALQARQLRNQAQNVRFAPGATLAERLTASASINMQAANQGADLVRQEGLKRNAMQQMTKSANMQADLRTRQMKAAALAANNETALSVKQAKQGLALAQQSLKNQFQQLQLTAQNATDATSLSAKQADIEFGMSILGASLSTIATVTSSVGQQMTANQQQFKTDIQNAYNSGQISKQQATDFWKQGPGLGTQLFGANTNQLPQAGSMDAYLYNTRMGWGGGESGGFNPFR